MDYQMGERVSSSHISFPPFLLPLHLLLSSLILMMGLFCWMFVRSGVSMAKTDDTVSKAKTKEELDAEEAADEAAEAKEAQERRDRGQVGDADAPPPPPEDNDGNDDPPPPPPTDDSDV